MNCCLLNMHVELCDNCSVLVFQLNFTGAPEPKNILNALCMPNWPSLPLTHSKHVIDRVMNPPSAVRQPAIHMQHSRLQLNR